MSSLILQETLADLAQSWDNSLLEESNNWSFITFVGLVAMIRDQMSVEMRPMMPGQAYPDLAPTAPTENLSSV